MYKGVRKRGGYNKCFFYHTDILNLTSFVWKNTTIKVDNELNYVYNYIINAYRRLRGSWSLQNPEYGQHLSLLYVIDSGAPILYHESEPIPWMLSTPLVHGYTMIPYQNHESCPYHKSLSISIGTRGSNQTASIHSSITG